MMSTRDYALVLAGLVTICRSSSSDPDQELLVIPQQRFPKSSRLKSSSTADTLSYGINLGTKTLEFQLEESTMSLSSVPVYIATSERIWEVNLGSDSTDQRTKFYHDMHNMAALSATEATISKNGVISHRLEGTFMYNNEFYSIRPLNASRSGSKQRRVTKLKSSETATHEVKKLQLPVTAGDSEGMLWSSVLNQSLNDDRHSQRKMDSTSAERYKRAAGAASYEVDMLYVTDYAAFTKFLQFESADDPKRSENAMRQMRYYFCHVANAVDLRYRAITTMGWTIRTKLIGLHIAMTSAQSTWTEPIKHSASLRSGQVVNASIVIDLFNDWVQVEYNSSQYDHAVLFTGYDIYKTINGSVNYDVVGLAFVAGACTQQKVAVVEVSGALNEGQTHAHELGHNLNAQHDGDGNRCSSKDNFIMASTADATSNGTHQNFYLFSNCSLEAFDTFIEYLNSETMNCLTDARPIFNDTEYVAYSEQLPGQRYNATVQCQQALGKTWTTCGGKTYAQQICQALWCHNSAGEVDGCQSAQGGTRGAEGTTCGDRKWCQNGECVYSASAPAASDACPLGEALGKVYNNYNYTCATMPSRYCYESYIQDKCCDTCPLRRNGSMTGCEFGDRQDCSSVLLADCYDAEKRNTCCSFCQTQKRNVTGCEYGDLYENCANMTAEGLCYNDTSVCCQSCAKRYDPYSDTCRYGDRSDSFCSTLVAEDCPQYSADCCKTCAALTATTTVMATTTKATTAASTTLTTRLVTSASPAPATTYYTTARVSSVVAGSTSRLSSSTTIPTTTAVVTTTRNSSVRVPTLYVRRTYPPRTLAPRSASGCSRSTVAFAALLVMLARMCSQ